ncbi:type I polyketide synthase [Streptomyces sp. SID5473]|uniref:acyltransferase domain-containing protein n=1 Tax=Streptomyces sp. SID5473 TaxID=2690299 RepID=UPI00025CE96E|nr:acyl transferase [Streptomyces tsukubensis NRRL18488]
MGVLVLERLSDAERLGHAVLAVVRGSAVTSDGASNGLTAPNGLSQQRVIRKALAAAGLTAADVDVVEGHGTGTRLGDPVEADALLATYGQNRRDPVRLGSLKSNIGHATAAAGVASVIKMVQAIGAGTMPRTLHADEPSPAVDWTTGRVALLTENRPWPDDESPRRAAVSAFGLSGTNAHLVLEQHRPAPAGPRPARAEPRPVPWVLSARSPAALRAQAARLRDHLAAVPAADPLDIGYALATSRARLPYRAAAVATDTDGFRTVLDGIADGVDAPGAVTGTARDRRIAFLFDGQGTQRTGMGRELHRSFPVFAAAWDEVSDAFAGQLEHSPTDVFHGAHGELANDTLYAQAGLFTLEVALLRLLDHWGVRPDVVVGHSVGEVTAAHAAGVLTLTDATRLIVARGRALQALPPGAMTAVDGSLAEVGAFTGSTDLDVAAVNGPTGVVLTGSPDDVAAFEREWAAAGRRAKRLDVGHAFHSRHVDGALDDFRTVLESIPFGAAQLPVVSTTTGREAADDLATPEHWLRHARRPVLFADAVLELADRGVNMFVAVGPSGALASAASENTGGDAGTYHSVLRARAGEETAALTAAAELHVHGAPVDLAVVLDGGRPVDLPVYPFQHRHYWLASGPGRSTPTASPDTGWGEEPEAGDLGIAEIVRRSTAALLGVTDPADVDTDSTFFALGFDSLAVQRLRNRLTSATGLDLPTSVLFDHDTPAALTAYLEDRLGDGADDDPPTVLELLTEMESLDAADIAATPAPERAAIADLLDTLSRVWKDHR